MNDWTYKGFLASVEFSAEDNLLVGKIVGIDSLVLFSAENVANLKTEFKKAVDEYLDDCELLGVAPQLPFKGSFNIRPGADLHRRLHLVARKQKISLNEAVKRAIGDYVDKAEVARKLGDKAEIFLRVDEGFSMHLRPGETFTGPYPDRSGVASIRVLGDDESYAYPDELRAYARSN